MVSRMHIERIFYIGLSSRVIMKFGLYADALPALLRQHIDFVRRAAPHQHDIGARRPAVGAKHLSKKHLKRKAARSERKNGTLNAVARSYGRLFLLAKHFECVPINFFGEHSLTELLHHLRDDARTCGG